MMMKLFMSGDIQYLLAQQRATLVYGTSGVPPSKGDRARISPDIPLSLMTMMMMMMICSYPSLPGGHKAR